MKNLSEHQKGILFVFIAGLLWSTGGLFIKLITLPAMQLAFFRCVIAATAFGIIFRKRILLFNKMTLLNSVFYASILITFVIATKTTTAANAIFLQSTAPIYVLIFEPIFNKTKYEKINIITVAVCVLGMILFFVGKLEPGHLEGNIIALLSGIAFASFFLGMKKNDPKYQHSSIFYGNILVAIISIPFLFSIEVLTTRRFYDAGFSRSISDCNCLCIFLIGFKENICS